MRRFVCIVSVAACLAATPVLSQDYDPWSDTWEWPSYVEPPSSSYSDNPALDREMDRWDREQQRNALRLYQERAVQEQMRQRGLAGCATIWNNPAAAAECARAHGEW